MCCKCKKCEYLRINYDLLVCGRIKSKGDLDMCQNDILNVENINVEKINEKKVSQSQI